MGNTTFASKSSFTTIRWMLLLGWKVLRRYNGYCKASASQCADCKGTWCTDCLPPFTTAAPPSPAPSPSGCPGGSLNACIDLCPADVFAQCVESCKSRCDSALI